VLLLLLACTASPDPPRSGPSGTAGDDTAAPDSAVDTATDTARDSAADTAWDSDAEPLDVTAEIVEEVVTVVRVRWRTAVETRGRVHFGEDADLGRRTDRTPLGLDHEVLLLGMPEQTEVHFQVVSEDGGGVVTWLQDVDTITTGSLPAGLPIFEVTGTAPSWDDVIVGPITGAADHAVMIDNQGRIVWYNTLPDAGQLMRASLSWDRREMITFMAGPRGQLEDGYAVRVSLDLSESSRLGTPGVDHDMIELPQGGYAAIVVVEPPDPDAAPDNSLADAIVEFDLDGTTREIWNAWEVLDEHARANTNWTHANALDYDPVSDTYTVSLKDGNAFVHVDAETGETLWVLGGPAEQFSYVGSTLPVPHHHQFHLVGDRLVLFDNGDALSGRSRAVELLLDTEALTAESVWSYAHDPDYSVTAKGDVQRFSDGNTQIVWSSEGEIQDVSPTGEVVWQLNGPGVGFVFTEHAELYRGD